MVKKLELLYVAYILVLDEASRIITLFDDRCFVKNPDVTLGSRRFSLSLTQMLRCIEATLPHSS